MGHIVGSLCINQDLTDYIVASRLHQEMVSFQHPAEEDEAEELFAHDISEVMEDMVRTELGMVRSQLLTCRRKISLVLSEIWRTEAFLMSKAPLNMWQSVWVLRILPFTIT